MEPELGHCFTDGLGLPGEQLLLFLLLLENQANQIFISRSDGHFNNSFNNHLCILFNRLTIILKTA